MKISTFRDWAISVASIVFIIAVLALSYYVAVSVTKMNKQIEEYTSTTSSASSDTPSIYTTESINCYASEKAGKYIAEITMQNTGSKEINVLTCKVYDSGILKVDQSTKEIKNLLPGSSDLCLFELSGIPNNAPVKFEFSYDDIRYTRFCMMN